MKVLILYGSPHRKGATAQLTAPFADELRKCGAEVSEEWIYEKHLEPCRGCGVCQDRIGEVGCVHDDDFAPLVDEIAASDLVVFATPIYAWFLPGPVKTFMDRLIYAPIKKYGRETAPSLLSGRATAIIVTSGYPPKETVVPFEMSLRKLSECLGMNYLGWSGGTDPGKGKVFMNEKKEQRMRSFAHELLSKL